MERYGESNNSQATNLTMMLVAGEYMRKMSDSQEE
jgi:hypothetical protein